MGVCTSKIEFSHFGFEIVDSQTLLHDSKS